MSKGKQPVLDPEQTLRTLDQLSQTIDVMSQVIFRLRRQMSRQLRQYEQNRQALDPLASASENGNPGETPDSRSAGSAPEAPGIEICPRRPKTLRRQSRVLH